MLILYVCNVASNFEQVLEATHHENPPTVRPPTSCWRNRDELISDVLLWTPARTDIQQLCEDTGCSHEDLPEAMNDREEWRERVRDIRACDTTS